MFKSKFEPVLSINCHCLTPSHLSYIDWSCLLHRKDKNLSLLVKSICAYSRENEGSSHM